MQKGDIDARTKEPLALPLLPPAPIVYPHGDKHGIIAMARRVRAIHPVRHLLRSESGETRLLAALLLYIGKF